MIEGVWHHKITHFVDKEVTKACHKDVVEQKWYTRVDTSGDTLWTDLEKHLAEEELILKMKDESDTVNKIS